MLSDAVYRRAYNVCVSTSCMCIYFLDDVLSACRSLRISLILTWAARARAASACVRSADQRSGAAESCFAVFREAFFEYARVAKYNAMTLFLNRYRKRVGVCDICVSALCASTRQDCKSDALLQTRAYKPHDRLHTHLNLTCILHHTCKSL